MKTLVIRGLFAAMLSATPAFAEQASLCIIAVDGTVYLNEPCDVERREDSFTVYGEIYFSYVSTSAPMVGYWNGNPPGNKAHEILGEMKKSGPCYSNGYATICAIE